MAKQHLNLGEVTIAATDRSTEISSASITYEVDELATESFGDTAHRFEGGLLGGQLNITWRIADDMSGALTQVFNAIGTVVAITAKANSGTTTAANPEYQFNVLISQAVPFGGDVGGILEQSTTWPIDGAVTLATS